LLKEVSLDFFKGFNTDDVLIIKIPETETEVTILNGVREELLEIPGKFVFVVSSDQNKELAHDPHFYFKAGRYYIG